MACLSRPNVDSRDLADVAIPGVIVLGGGGNPHLAGWEFSSQAQQDARFAGNS